MEKRLKLNRNSMLYICILGILLTSTIQGLSDWDFIWQSYLGEQIVKEGRFNALGDLIWGTKHISTYIDHEWLTNIIFYFYDNLFGTAYGVMFVKITLELILGLSLCYFIHLFYKDNLSNISYISICLLVAIFSICAMKPKAFIVSVILLVWLLIICESYTNENISFIVFSILTVLLCLLWNNFHSGSIILFFCFYGAYWLFKWREKRILCLGIVTLGSLIVNPFGLDLIIFDIEHFSDNVMKSIIRDWHYLDLTMSTGIIILAFIVIVFFHLFNLSLKEDLLYIILFLGIFIMTINSMRHFIYMLPLGILIISKGQFDNGSKEESVLFLITYFVSLFTILLLLLLFGYAFYKNINDTKEIYVMDYLDEELENILVETNKEQNEGLFVPDVNIWDLGLKSFYSGAFPHTRQRSIDGYILMYGTNKQIEDIILYYELDRFLVYNTYDSETGYTLNSSLYDYMCNNEKYLKLYDNGVLSYFVTK